MPTAAPRRDSRADVSHNEPGGVYPVQFDSGRRLTVEPASDLDRDRDQEFPDGLFLELFCRRSIYELGVPEDLPQGGVKRAERRMDVYASSFPRNFFACK